MPRLELPQPFDFELSTERFRVFGRDLANLWHEGGLHRVVDGREVRIEPAPAGVEASALDRRIEPELRHLLGAGFDLVAFEQFAHETDATLARLAGRLRGFRPPLAPDPFEMLVGSVTAQQVSLHAAFAVRSRFIERFGERGELAYAFPTPERVARAGEDELLALGFSRRKAEYVLGLARGALDLDALARLDDEEARAAIVAVRGFGEWTADWFLARHRGSPDAWPAGDLGLRKAVGIFYGDGRMPSIAETRAAGERFSPWRNLAAHYLLLGSRLP
jgi:3-methyladenine DNA glycosylase/8-oxoguanine DNA glycosylase